MWVDEVNCISYILGKVIPHPIKAIRWAIWKWHLVGQMMFFLEWELFLIAKINLGNGNFFCSLLSLFVCQIHFHWVSLPSLSPWGKLLSINHVRFAVGYTFLSEQVNILWGKTGHRTDYLKIQKKLVLLTPPATLTRGKLAGNNFLHF